MGIASRNYGDAERSTSHRAPSTKAQYKQKRVLRSFFVVITKKIRERRESSEGGG